MNSSLLADLDQVTDHTRKRLLHNWIILTGDIGIIQEIERSCFPPQTKANNLFEAVIHPCYYFCICKKTKRLQRLLSDVLDFEETLIITFIENMGADPDRGPFLIHQVLVNPQWEFKASVNRFVERFFDFDLPGDKPEVDIIE